MKKKRGGGDDGGNWMDTYGDMVTLLLCFFVMLYSMSSLSEAKWEIFVRSIYPNSTNEVDEITINGVVDDSEETSNGTPEIPEIEAEVPDLDELYLTIAEKMNEMGIEGVTISRGEDYTFIVFQDKTFFDGDSSVLTAPGEDTLDVFCEAIAPAYSQIEQVDIMAHTAQGEPDRPNNPRTDRMLSAMRAAEVCVYIQNKDILEPEKLVNISYGQFRPIDTNDTTEGRARNRRVEILMIDEGADVRSLNEYYEEYTSGTNDERTIITDGIPSDGDHGFAPAEEPQDEGVSSMMSPLSTPEEGTPVPEEGAPVGAEEPVPEVGAPAGAEEAPVPDAGESPVVTPE